MVIDKDFIAKIHVYPHRFSTEPFFSAPGGLIRYQIIAYNL